MTEFHQFENISGHAIKSPVLVQNGQKLTDGLDCYSRIQTKWQVFGTCMIAKDFHVVQLLSKSFQYLYHLHSL